MSDRNSIYCPSCRQKTSLEQRVEWVGHGHIYQIGECNGCEQCFLVKRNGRRDIVDIQPKTLASSVDKAIPSPIYEDIEEAYKCQSVQAWRAAVTMARRAMQNICLQKGAPSTRDITTKEGKTKTIKNDLVHQIDWLFDERIITKDLKDWAHEIRTVGNSGAHPGDATDEQPVEEKDALDILSLVEAFCGPLYIAASVYNSRKNIEDDI